MAQVKVRDLDEWIVNVLRDNALNSGHSLEQHLRILLKDAALASQLEFAKEQAKHLVVFEEKFGTLPDSTEGLREERWQRG